MLANPRGGSRESPGEHPRLSDLMFQRRVDIHESPGKRCLLRNGKAALYLDPQLSTLHQGRNVRYLVDKAHLGLATD